MRLAAIAIAPLEGVNKAFVARAGLRAMFARKAVCMPGLLTRIMTFCAVLLPQLVIDLARRRAPWLGRP